MIGRQAAAVWMLAMTLLATGCASQQALPPAPPRGTIVFSIVSGREDPQKLTMAMQLAGHALADQRRVVLFFNVRGVEVATKNFPADLAYHADPIKGMLADLVRRGAIVLVCPDCMKAAGLTQADLIDKAQVAGRATLFGAVDANTAIFTY